MHRPQNAEEQERDLHIVTIETDHTLNIGVLAAVLIVLLCCAHLQAKSSFPTAHRECTVMRRCDERAA
ncbi:MAG: hypothetical protein ACRDRW_15035 [Pseudonocardiaceae bacterium]